MPADRRTRHVAVVVNTTSRTGGYEVKSGTSMAAPHVAGLAALMASVAPNLPVAELRALLLQHAARADVPVSAGYADALGAVLAASEATSYDATQPPRLRISVQNRTRIFTTGTGVPVHREPQVLQLVGEVSAESFAADSVVIGAVLEVEAALVDPGLNDEERYAVCELAANRAQTIVQPLVIGATSKLFDGLGASSTSVVCNLDRHWRNARTIATHNPAIYKARIVGDYEINAVQPQRLSVTGEDSNHRGYGA